MPPRSVPFLRASEIAEYVYCAHACSLHRGNTPVSEVAQDRMDAGVRWQAEKDQQIADMSAPALQLQRRSVRAWRIVWMVLILIGVGIWILHSLSH